MGLFQQSGVGLHQPPGGVKRRLGVADEQGVDGERSDLVRCIKHGCNFLLRACIRCEEKEQLQQQLGFLRIGTATRAFIGRLDRRVAVKAARCRRQNQAWLTSSTEGSSPGDRVLAGVAELDLEDLPRGGLLVTH